MTDEDREGEEWKPEESQDPDSLILRKTGEAFGVPIFTQDFAAFDFEHRDCKLTFKPLFMVYPEKCRVPEYEGMLITCKKHGIVFRKDP